ncbi:MAG: T9SS type A sorting domain-containing protein [Ekhidna sp.]
MKKILFLLCFAVAGMASATVPVFQSATATSTTTIDIVYDINIDFGTTEAAFIAGLNAGGGLDKTGASASITGTTITLTLVVPLSADYTASDLAILVGTVKDDSSADLNAGVSGQNIDDGISPELVSAVLTSSTTIDFTFSEDINYVTSDASFLTSVSAAGLDLTGASVTDPAGASSVITLTLDGAQAVGTDYTASTLVIGLGEVEDQSLADNGNAAISGGSITDGADPEFVSAVATTPTTIDITFSEDINYVTSDASFLASVSATGLDLTGASASDPLGTNSVITVTLAGPQAVASDYSAPDLVIGAGEVEDVSAGTFPNAVVGGTIDDGISPELLSAVLTSSTTIDFTFSEDINYVTSDASFLASVSAAGLDLTGASVTDPLGASSVITLTLAGAQAVGTDYTASTLVIGVGEVEDQSVANNSNAAISGASITDGAAPVIISAITGDTGGTAGEIDQMTVTFSEDIDGGTLDTDGGSDDFIVTDGAYTYTITSVAVNGTDGATITLTERGSPDTGVTPDINLGVSDIEDQAPSDNSLTVAQDFTATQDGAAPVLYNFTLQPTNSFIEVVYSEPIQQVGTGTPVLGDFNENQANVTPSTTITINSITDALGDPLTGPEDTIQFTLTVGPVPSTYDAGDNVVIDTDGTTLEDAAGNPLGDGETTGAVQVNDVNNVVTIVDAIWVTTSAPADFEGYIELEFSDGVFGSASDKAVRLANSDNGIYEQGNWTDGSALCDNNDQLCATYASSGSSAFVNSDSNNDIELRAGDNGSGGATDEDKEIRFSNNDANNISNYDGSKYRFYLNDIDNGPWTGEETYTFGPANASSGKINGRTTASTMLGSYTFVFTLPDLTINDFDNATATALDVDGDGNIDEVEVVMPDGIEDATVTLADFQFNSIAADGFDTGATPDDNTFRLTFSSYTGTAVVGNLVYTAGTLEDDAQVNASYLASGNLYDGGTITPVDGAGPVIRTATTYDTEATPNGTIDEIIIEFSEAFSDIGPIATGSFTIPGFNVSGVLVASPNVTLTVDSTGTEFDTYVTPNITVAAAILEDLSAGAADNPLQTFSTTSDGAAAYSTVDVLATANQNPEITGEIDDVNAQILLSVGGNTKSATNNANGTWTLPAGSLDTPLPVGATYDVILTTIDPFTNIGSDDSSNELTINGGVTISPAPLESLCTDGVFTTIGDITLTETDDGGIISSGNIILSLPPGFEFNTSVLPTFSGAGYNDITIDLESAVDAEETEFIGTASISIEIDNDGSADETDVIIISGLQVSAVGSIARAADNMYRSGGDLSISLGTDVYASFESNLAPAEITSVDETVNTLNAITSLNIRSGINFNLQVSDVGQDEVRWDEIGVGADPDYTAAAAPFDATAANLGTPAVGLHTYAVTNFVAVDVCESSPFEFELLIYSDDDPTIAGIDSTFISKSYLVTDDTDTIYISNPAGHTVNVSGAGTTVTNPGDSPNPLLVIFDPGIADDDGAGGAQAHTITYSITNNTTGASTTESVVFTVEPETEIFVSPLPPPTPIAKEYCSNEGGGILDLTVDFTGFNSAIGIPLPPTPPTPPYINTLFVNGLRHGFTDFPSGAGIENGTEGPGAFQYRLNINALSVPLGDFESVRFEREIVEQVGVIQRKRVDAVNYFIFYGLPDVSLSNIGTVYCEDDAVFTINRNLQYVQSVNQTDPDNPIPTFGTENNQAITNGYMLYRSNDGGATYPTLYADFTASGILTNTFDPTNPDQDANIGEATDVGFFRIQYMTETLTPSNCTTTITVDLIVNADTPTPTLDAATAAGGGSTGFVINASPDPGIDSDEYVLEYCAGTALLTIGTNAGTNVRWYDENLNPLDDIEDFAVAPANELGITTVGGANRLTEQSVIFYFSEIDATNCESDLRKVTLEVYANPDNPIVSNAEATEVGANSYEIDYCDGDTYLNIDLDDLSGFTNANYLARLDYYADINADVGSATPTSSVGITSLGPNSFVNINGGPFAIGATGVYVYQVSRRENTNASSSFIGCSGLLTTIRINVNPVTTAPTVADVVSLGATIVHVCEGGAFADIRFQSTGIDEYVFYDTDGTTEIARIGNGETVSQGDIVLQATNSDFDVDGNGVLGFGTYDFQLTRLTGFNDRTGFIGCESAAMTFSIEVHEILEDEIPTIVSSDYTDLNVGPDTYQFAVCLSELLPGSTLTAASPFANPKEFVWYAVDDITGANPSELLVSTAPTFNDLGMGIGDITIAQSKFFEVTQRFDTDDFAPGEACEIPAGAIIQVTFSDQDAIDIANVDDGDQFCTSDTDFTLDLQVDNGGGFMPAAFQDIIGYEIRNATDLSLIDSDFDAVNGVGNPTTDLKTWHEDATGNMRDAEGNIVGGDPSMIQITLTYEDPAANCIQNVVNTITINPDPNVSIALNGVNSNALEFCYDDPPVSIAGFDIDDAVIIASNIGSGSFSINTGGGLTNTGNNSAEFNPRNAHDVFHGGASGTTPFASQSEHRIAYSFTDNFGCQRDTTLFVYVNPRPQIVTGTIQASNSCAVDNIELFVDMSDDESNYTFSWRVGGATIDNSSAELTDLDGNISDAFLTYNLETVSGNFGVTVTNNTTGCQTAINLQQITVGEAPVPSLTWVGTTEGRTTSFSLSEDNNALPDDNIDSIGVIVDGIQEVSILGASNITLPYSFDYSFLSSGSYTVEYGMRTTAGCRINGTREVLIIDHVTGLSPTAAYAEDFEIDNGGWTVETLSLDGKSNMLSTSWERGIDIPDLAGDGTASGSNAFYTNGYLESEVSFVYSPSFDLRAFNAPTISFLRLEDFETFRDGVVFQMSIDDGRNWVNVGSFNAGLSGIGLASTPGWYNREAITSAPGSVSPPGAPLSSSNNNQGIGWAENSDWETAISPISVPPTAQYARFRFALSAQAGTKTTQGFGFDLVEIYERDQVVLVEQFSTTLREESKAVNTIIDNENIFNTGDVVRINYFTDFANNGDSLDILNQRNTSAPGARSSFYGIEDVPSVAIAGTPTLISDEDQFNSLAAQLTNAKLNNPGFTITINASIDDQNELTVGADFEAISEIGSDNAKLGLFIAILEPMIIIEGDENAIGRYVDGDTITNVMRRMLPTPAGQFEEGAVAISDVLSISPITWPVSNMYTKDTLAVVAYVQDLTSKLILQSSILGLSNPNAELALGLSDIKDFVLYPNPADKEVTVEFADGIAEDTEWIIYDGAGREVLKGEVSRGTRTMTVQTADVPSGMYFIHLYGEDRKREAKRIMIVH